MGVLPKQQIGTSHAGTSLSDVRRTVPHGVLVGGHAAQQIDQVNATYGAFPLMFGLVALVTFLLLARGLKSILLPAKAVLLNAVSVAATYGVVVLVWQHGIGTQALWGVSGTGSVDTFVPMLMFGFLFGISMDYEVFILSRVREGYDRTGSTHQGIVEGVSRTGRLVTSAALPGDFPSISGKSGAAWIRCSRLSSTRRQRRPSRSTRRGPACASCRWRPSRPGR